ncbi:MAG: hypothetical protein ABEJ83_00600 [Candidatus Nanohaloarchaea archaeon]
MTKQLEKMKKIDELAIAALGMNAYVIYTQAGLNYSELLEPMATTQITFIQASVLLGAIYLFEYMGDEEESSSSIRVEEEEGFIDGIAGMIETNKWVDLVTIAVVFLGFRSIKANAGYGISLFQLKLDPANIALQLSVLMMLNFGLQFIGDLKS